LISRVMNHQEEFWRARLRQEERAERAFQLRIPASPAEQPMRYLQSRKAGAEYVNSHRNYYDDSSLVEGSRLNTGYGFRQQYEGLTHRSGFGAGGKPRNFGASGTMSPRRPQTSHLTSSPLAPHAAPPGLPFSVAGRRQVFGAPNSRQATPMAWGSPRAATPVWK